MTKNDLQYVQPDESGVRLISIATRELSRYAITTSESALLE
jgi:hypothetical protein